MPLTLLNNYYGIINVRVDIYLYNIQKDEIFLIESIDCKSINENERKQIINQPYSI